MTETPIPTTLLRAVLWRRLDEPSFDLCRLREMPDAYILDGRVLTVWDGQPAEVFYAVRCERNWATREAHIVRVHGQSSTRLHVRRDELDQWWRNDVKVAEVDGLEDVDLAITPATNTLAIRRMSLGTGESRSSDAVWVRFPELTVERLPQRYTRVDDRLYRYESHDGAFAADIEVDEEGVVVRYGELWERLAP